MKIIFREKIRKSGKSRKIVAKDHEILFRHCYFYSSFAPQNIELNDIFNIRTDENLSPLETTKGIFPTSSYPRVEEMLISLDDIDL
jgi:hypothetical protein